MGAWGEGPFDNDDAMDFVGELADVPADELVARLHGALALPDDYVEIPEGSSAVAAAALVAARRGYNPDNPSVADPLAAHPFDADDSLRSSASVALVRVAAEGSELMELWDEAGLRESVEKVYRDIGAFLCSHTSVPIDAHVTEKSNPEGMVQKRRPLSGIRHRPGGTTS